MYYTIAPQLDPNISHLGFWVVLGVVVLCTFANVTAMWSSRKRGELLWWVGIQVLLVSALGVVWYNSYMIKFPVPENVPVEATLVTGDGYAGVVQCGTKGREMCNYSHVVYNTPDGDVSFRRSTGVVYPRKAILYRSTTSP